MILLSIVIPNFVERQVYLLQNYRPLIYTSKDPTVKDQDVLNDFFHIFLILWIKNGSSPSDLYKEGNTTIMVTSEPLLTDDMREKLKILLLHVLL